MTFDSLQASLRQDENDERRTFSRPRNVCSGWPGDLLQRAQTGAQDGQGGYHSARASGEVSDQVRQKITSISS